MNVILDQMVTDLPFDPMLLLLPLWSRAFHLLIDGLSDYDGRVRKVRAFT